MDLADLADWRTSVADLADSGGLLADLADSLADLADLADRLVDLADSGGLGGLRLSGSRNQVLQDLWLQLRHRSFPFPCTGPHLHCFLFCSKSNVRRRVTTVQSVSQFLASWPG